MLTTTFLLFFNAKFSIGITNIDICIEDDVKD